MRPSVCRSGPNSLWHFRRTNGPTRGNVIVRHKHHLIERTTYSSERTDAADTARTRAEPL